jgi:hypothetical protein
MYEVGSCPGMYTSLTVTGTTCLQEGNQAKEQAESGTSGKCFIKYNIKYKWNKRFVNKAGVHMMYHRARSLRIHSAGVLWFDPHVPYFGKTLHFFGSEHFAGPVKPQEAHRVDAC